MSSEIVLITEKELAKGGDSFQSQAFDIRSAPADEELLAAEVRKLKCRAVVVGVTPYVGPLYEALAEVAGDRPALLARMGVGHDNIDKALVHKFGLILTNTPGTLDNSVAEHSLWLLGALAKHVALLDAQMRLGNFTPITGYELCDKSLVVVGFGNIGRRVAKAAHFGLGMRVTAVGTAERALRTRREERRWQKMMRQNGADRGYTDDLDGALADADAVTIHASANPRSHHLFNAERMAKLPKHALLVNTSRGSLIDEAALFDALQRNAFAGAALDVFEHEPYRPVAEGKDLRALENILMTPHVSSNTVEANRRMAQSVMQTLDDFFGGRVFQLRRV